MTRRALPDGKIRKNPRQWVARRAANRTAPERFSKYVFPFAKRDTAQERAEKDRLIQEFLRRSGAK